MRYHLMTDERNDDMQDDKVRKTLDIPKRYALADYIRKLGELYGEVPEVVEPYIEEQLAANGDNLDKGIECFKTAFEIGQALKHGEK